MTNIIIPEGYKSTGTIKETEIAIKDVKDYFERALAKELNLTRVSAPLSPNCAASGASPIPTLSKTIHITLLIFISRLHIHFIILYHKGNVMYYYFAICKTNVIIF